MRYQAYVTDDQGVPLRIVYVATDKTRDELISRCRQLTIDAPMIELTIKGVPTTFSFERMLIVDTKSRHIMRFHKGGVQHDMIVSDATRTKDYSH